MIGQCSDGYQLEFSETVDEFECLEYCQTVEECEWFTFYESESLCESFSNCTSIDAEDCDDCISGQKECTVEDPPVCWVAG